jgi:hypothetical protein
MSKLPIEIIDQISDYLTISDKLNLSCASKKLYGISTFYNKLVFRSMDSFNQAMDLSSKNDISRHVRRLVIDEINCDAQTIVTIPSVFPCVKHLDWKVNEDPASRAFPSVDFDISMFKWAIKN